MKSEIIDDSNITIYNYAQHKTNWVGINRLCSRIGLKGVFSVDKTMETGSDDGGMKEEI